MNRLFLLVTLGLITSLTNLLGVCSKITPAERYTKMFSKSYGWGANSPLPSNKMEMRGRETFPSERHKQFYQGLSRTDRIIYDSLGSKDQNALVNKTFKGTEVRKNTPFEQHKRSFGKMTGINNKHQMYYRSLSPSDKMVFKGLSQKQQRILVDNYDDTPEANQGEIPPAEDEAMNKLNEQDNGDDSEPMKDDSSGTMTPKQKAEKNSTKQSDQNIDSPANRAMREQKTSDDSGIFDE